ncbi:MAG: multiheme c-type cytochrome (seleno)protein ExtKL [Thermodesulfovibrionales bacterium]
MKYLRLILIMAFLALPVIAFAEFNTIDDLAKAYSDEACKSCHGKVHDEWKSSLHAQSVVHSLGGIRNFIVAGLGKEWNKPVSKEHLMRCMDCHAPQLKDASESLIKHVADLIVTAVDKKDESAKKELAKLNVNCVVCHNTKVSIEKNLRGAPEKGVYHGPTGKASPAHRTVKSNVITSAVFCGQCHRIHTSPDGDTIVCNTLYGSYQDAYRANGGTETCQDCHMKKENRGHTFPGAYQEAILKDGLAVDANIAGIRLHPGKWIPTAIVNVGLTNKAGHRIPDG